MIRSVWWNIIRIYGQREKELEGFLCFVGNKVGLLLLVFSDGISASLYMSELILITLRME